MAHISRYIGTFAGLTTAFATAMHELELAVDKFNEIARVLFEPTLERLVDILRHLNFIWKPDAEAALALDAIGRTVDPEAGSERAKPFKAFLERALLHTRRIGDGFDPGSKHGHMMLAA